jgi:hypothetical protein
MTEPVSRSGTPDDEKNTLEALRQQVQWARQALRVEVELPRLTYTEGEISVDGDVFTIPLSAGRTTAHLAMSPVDAKRLTDKVYAALSDRRRQAALKVLEGHTPEHDSRDGSGAYCAQDGEVWPCPTVIAIGEEGAS